MKYLIIPSIVLVLTACRNSKNVEVKSEEDEGPIVGQMGDVTAQSDAMHIDTAFIDGHILNVIVNYSGGCEKHWFEIVGSFALLKTNPPKRSIKIIHESNGDLCDEVLSKDLQFDVSEFAYQKETGKEVLLMLDGYDHHISYVYP